MQWFNKFANHLNKSYSMTSDQLKEAKARVSDLRGYL